MADIWSELVPELRNRALANNIFASNATDMYFYTVPSDADRPYVTCFDTVSEHWMTLGNATSGERVPLRFVAYGDLASGGPSILRQIVSALDATYSLVHFETNNFKVISARRTSMSKPIEDPDNPSVYAQFIDFELILETK